MALPMNGGCQTTIGVIVMSKMWKAFVSMMVHAFGAGEKAAITIENVCSVGVKVSANWEQQIDNETNIAAVIAQKELAAAKALK